MAMTLDELIDRLEKATGPHREIDTELHGYCEPGFANFPRVPSGGVILHPDRPCVYAPRYTDDLSAIVALIERVLPGWAWKVGKCHLSDDAWVCPDHNDPKHSDRLHREFPVVPGNCWDQGFDIDRRPAGNPALALCLAFARALQSIKQEEPAQ